MSALSVSCMWRSRQLTEPMHQAGMVLRVTAVILARRVGLHRRLLDDLDDWRSRFVLALGGTAGSSALRSEAGTVLGRGAGSVRGGAARAVPGRTSGPALGRTSRAALERTARAALSSSGGGGLGHAASYSAPLTSNGRVGSLMAGLPGAGFRCGGGPGCGLGG